MCLQCSLSLKLKQLNVEDVVEYTAEEFLYLYDGRMIAYFGFL